MSKIIKDIMKKRKAIVKESNETKEIIKSLETMQNAGMDVEPYLAKLEKESPEKYAAIEKALEVEADPKKIKAPTGEEKKTEVKEKETEEKKTEGPDMTKIAETITAAIKKGHEEFNSDKPKEEKAAFYQ